MSAYISSFGRWRPDARIRIFLYKHVGVRGNQVTPEEFFVDETILFLWMKQFPT